MTTTIQKFTKRLTAAVLAASAVLSFTESADAQEILLTGPLAGAPAVRKLRLYREGRFEIAPSVTFSLLDEYQRTIMFGGRINYNLTDWFAIGVWGAHGTIKIATILSQRIQDVNAERQALGPTDADRRSVALNMSADFTKQLSSASAPGAASATSSALTRVTGVAPPLPSTVTVGLGVPSVGSSTSSSRPLNGPVQPQTRTMVPIG